MEAIVLTRTLGFLCNIIFYQLAITPRKQTCRESAQMAFAKCQTLRGSHIAFIAAQDCSPYLFPSEACSSSSAVICMNSFTSAFNNLRAS